MKLFELQSPKKHIGNSKYFDYIVDRFINLGYTVDKSGLNSAVCYKNNSNYIYKIYINDYAYHSYIKYCEENPHIFLPTVYKIYKISNDSLGIVKLEKLYHKNKIEEKYKKNLLDKINELTKIFNFDLDISLDEKFKIHNIMFTKDNIPVIIDPFYGNDIIKNNDKEYIKILTDILNNIHNDDLYNLKQDEMMFIKNNFEIFTSFAKMELRKYFTKNISLGKIKMTDFIRNILYENYNKIIIDDLIFTNNKIDLINDIECGDLKLFNCIGTLSNNLIVYNLYLYDTIIELPESLKKSHMIKISENNIEHYKNKYNWENIHVL